MTGPDRSIPPGKTDDNPGSRRSIDDSGAVIDQQLMARIQAGDKSALAELYDRHAPQLLGIAYRILQQKDDAEDLLHDVILEVWQRSASYQAERGTVVTWLRLRLRSRAIDRLRALVLARERSLAKVLSDQAIAPHDSSDPSVASEYAIAKRAVTDLSEVQRTVVELGYFEGLSCAEIAARCDVPIGTVKSRLSAALARLRSTFASNTKTSVNTNTRETRHVR